MPVAVLADAHIGGPGGAAGPLVRQLEALGGGCERLVVLGDLFHVWVASPRYETADIRAVLGALAALRSRGVRLDYVEGNRDFFLAGSAYAGLFERVGRETSFAAGGRRYLAVHGDGLNPRDRKYLFWRWLSKSAPSRFVMLHLPRVAVGPIVHGTERRLAQTNFEHKTHIPEPVILDYAERRLQGAYDVLLLGHYHQPRRWRVTGGEVLLLDAWYRCRRIELFGANGQGPTDGHPGGEEPNGAAPGAGGG